MPRGEQRWFEGKNYDPSKIKNKVNLIAEKKATKKLGIKRPNMLCDPVVPERLKLLSPKIKMIAVLRDPIERLYSAYFWHIRNGFIPNLEINDGLLKLMERSEFWKSSLFRDGFYYAGLNAFSRHFPSDQLLILEQLDVIQKPIETARKVFEFLDLQLNIADVYFSNTKRNSSCYNHTRLGLYQLRNKYIFKYSAEGYLKPRSPFAMMCNSAFVSLDTRILSRFLMDQQPALEDRLSQSLVELYSHDVEMLRTYFNVGFKFKNFT